MEDINFLDPALSVLNKPPDERSDAELEALRLATASYGYFVGIPPAIHKALLKCVFRLVATTFNPF